MLRFVSVVISICLIGFLVCPAEAVGQGLVRATLEPVRVCEAAPGQTIIPDFSDARCGSMRFWEIDPQHQRLWIEARFELTEALIASPGPKGVYISGVASSTVFLNGQHIGSNGRPGDGREDEIPGLMDAVIYAPQSLLQTGENRLVLHLSGHHGTLDLATPMHILGFGPYREPSARILQAYWPALIMMSLFALSTLIFSVLGFASEDREGPVILAVLSLCLGLMLMSEVARGLFAYPYPMHALRLIAILAAGWAIGVALIAHIIHLFSGFGVRRRQVTILSAAIIIALPLLWTTGFDGRTGYVLLTSFWLGAAGCVYWGWRGSSIAWLYAASLLAAGALLLATQAQFLDLHLYWIGAAFLFALFVRQTLSLVSERRTRILETERANRLDAALARAHQVTMPAQLKLIAGGRTEFVSTDDILVLKGAGDYVELRFRSGRTALHNATLAQLEQALPASFLRVHRSCIVNTGYVQGLNRDPGGGGRLILTGGLEAPVSRRIMPRVRTVLEAGAA